jgi:hypothetical protein
MSSYRGIYVQRLSDGTIHSVQVVDSAGNSIPLDPQVYLQRAIEPAMDALPDVAEFQRMNSK